MCVCVCVCVCVVGGTPLRSFESHPFFSCNRPSTKNLAPPLTKAVVKLVCSRRPFQNHLRRWWLFYVLVCCCIVVVLLLLRHHHNHHNYNKLQSTVTRPPVYRLPNIYGWRQISQCAFWSPILSCSNLHRNDWYVSLP